MSKIALNAPASGNGVITLTAPVTNTDRVLNLPDNSGTVLNENSNIEAQVKTATNATGTAPIFAARAWVNFNGTGVVAIRAAGNVSSILDNGVGDYTVNFATAMPDTNYSVTVSTSEIIDSIGQGNQEGHGKPVVLATNSCRVISHFHVMNIASRFHDSGLVNVAVFR